LHARNRVSTNEFGDRRVVPLNPLKVFNSTSETLATCSLNDRCEPATVYPFDYLSAFDPSICFGNAFRWLREFARARQPSALRTAVFNASLKKLIFADKPLP